MVMSKKFILLLVSFPIVNVSVGEILLNSLKVMPLHPNQHASQAGRFVERALHDLLVQVEKVPGHGRFQWLIFEHWSVQGLPAGRHAVTTPMVPSCWWSENEAKWRWCLYSGLRRWHLLVGSREIPKHNVGTHAAGPSRSTDLTGLLVNPNNTDLVTYTRKRGNFLVSLNLFSLELLCTVLCWSSIFGWSWILGWPGENMWISKWRLRSHCGPVRGPMAWCGAPKVVYWLYTSIIQPFITSASPVWLPYKIQTLVCLGIRQAMRNIPTGATETFTYLPPLHLLVQGKARSAAH